MRFNNDADVYMFVWSIRGIDRFIAQKEIWYDRATKQPRRVYLFDDNGRVILRAFLRNHAPLEVPGAPRDRRGRKSETFSARMQFRPERCGVWRRARAKTSSIVPMASTVLSSSE